MGNDDPTISKIYDRQDRHRDQVLDAIGKVNTNVQAVAVDTASTKATVEGLENRMSATEKRQDTRMDKIEARLWKVAGAGGATGIAASVALKVIFG